MSDPPAHESGDPRPARLPEFAANPAYYEHVARGYDRIATTYDAVEAQNAVGRRLRRRMTEALASAFHAGDRVLEIGCGTGIEAIGLAERGIDVVATDVSSEMVERVAAKAKARGLRNVTDRALAARDLDHIAEEFGPASFDGAFSHGGVLNMEPDLDRAAAALARLVRPRGHLLCTVVNQTSLFEIVVYPLALRPRKAFRRLGNEVPIPITRLEAYRRYVVPTRFYSPRAFARVFAPSFVVRHLRGLEILLPPWNLSEYVDRLEPLARVAETLEDWVGSRPPFNAWGCIFLADLERVGV